jgi:hypothetical protein
VVGVWPEAHSHPAVMPHKTLRIAKYLNCFVCSQFPGNRSISQCFQGDRKTGASVFVIIPAQRSQAMVLAIAVIVLSDNIPRLVPIDVLAVAT